MAENKSNIGLADHKEELERSSTCLCNKLKPIISSDAIDSMPKITRRPNENKSVPPIIQIAENTMTDS